ncbi:PREDICTED: uncharacterized protein LOC104800565 isoform X2 [Tarenaya hassleriana]|uniref:uncharacterized protein LOC104800565 isoform X1 n=1 Tax=Tarenaya hassleriana TaxID=28532 RepID=UPI00053C9340|nr:PREDICTED: uncharacterized protein LOC104800565 isoform X1 [Tarenaya hassleriana]XP_010521706.1 PREDICTED: uncharacterized protein LOC104800565 isoform X2 [Tarenaya hassleriana]
MALATRLNRILKQHQSTVSVLPFRNPNQGLFLAHGENLSPHVSQVPALLSSTRSFLDFYKLGNKKAIEEERARLKDEMTRGYFMDMKEYGIHGGKVAAANKTLIPAVAAMKFPVLAVTYPSGKTFKLPVTSNSNEVQTESSTVPKASLVCLSFRASSKDMIDSWRTPFLESFSNSKDVHFYEVSFIDKWLLCLSPVKYLLLRVLRNPKNNESTALQTQNAYSFGNHYYFRKQLRILNLLTGYVFLLDKCGRIRWQGVGKPTPEEVSSLLSCTSLLLEAQ